jgi:2,5-diamino-6-(ribosylamino)-4(3H)-pyrimidinone 5'-phosphate reductase
VHVKRPYVIVNCACSADGKIATFEHRQTKISSLEDMKRVHKLRASVDAVLVGIGTVLTDDPRLTVKTKYLGKAKNVKNPVRVVLDSRGRIPKNAKVLDGKVVTIVAVAKKPKRRIKGAEVMVCGKRGKVYLEKLMERLYDRGINKLLVEGGGETIWSFLSEGLVDELKIFVGSIVLGGGKAPTVADGEGARSVEKAVKLKLKNIKKMSGGILLEYLVVK